MKKCIVCDKECKDSRYTVCSTNCAMALAFSPKKELSLSEKSIKVNKEAKDFLVKKFVELGLSSKELK